MRGVGATISIAQGQPVPVRVPCVRVQLPDPHRPSIVLGGSQEHVSRTLVGLGESRIRGMSSLVQSNWSVPEQTGAGVGQPKGDDDGLAQSFVHGCNDQLRVTIEVEVSQQRLGGRPVTSPPIGGVGPLVAADHHGVVAPRPQQLARVPGSGPACNRTGQSGRPGIHVQRSGGVVSDQHLLDSVAVYIHNHRSRLDVLGQPHVYLPC